jgi:hypothetical protein
MMLHTYCIINRLNIQNKYFSQKAVVALLEKVLQKEDGIDDSDEEEIVSPTESRVIKTYILNF